MENLKRLHSKKLAQPDIDRLVEDVVTDINARTQPLKIYVFGSATTGSFDERSDIDLVLVYDTPEKAKAAHTLLYRHPPATDRKVDMLCIDQKSFEEKSEIGGVYWIAKREGRLILGSKPQNKE